MDQARFVANKPLPNEKVLEVLDEDLREYIPESGLLQDISGILLIQMIRELKKNSTKEYPFTFDAYGNLLVSLESKHAIDT
jgi:hypothetical protein